MRADSVDRRPILHHCTLCNRPVSSKGLLVPAYRVFTSGEREALDGLLFALTWVLPVAVALLSALLGRSHLDLRRTFGARADGKEKRE